MIACQLDCVTDAALTDVVSPPIVAFAMTALPPSPPLPPLPSLAITPPLAQLTPAAAPAAAFPSLLLEARPPSAEFPPAFAFPPSVSDDVLDGDPPPPGIALSLAAPEL